MDDSKPVNLCTIHHKHYSRIPAIRNPPIRNLALEILEFHAEIAVSLIADCIIDVKLRN